jgi:hypothetical protein
LPSARCPITAWLSRSRGKGWANVLLLMPAGFNTSLSMRSGNCACAVSTIKASAIS